MKTYGAYVAKTWDQAILSSVLLELTYACNLDCFFCYNDLAQRGERLSREDYFALLDDLAHMQVLNLVLSGGEPLAHPDFWAIGARARELGFVVRVKSNGHALGPTLARRLKDEVDPFVVDLSIHGASAETHDRQTRVPGSFERLLANIAAMQAAGLRLKLNSPLTRWNEHEAEAMLALADGLGLRLGIDTRLTPRDDGDLEPLSISPSVAGIARVLELHQQRIAAGRNDPGPNDDEPAPVTRHHCGAGASTLTVDPFGQVYPCVQWRRAIGNLHERSIADLWQGSRELEQVRKVTAAVKAQFATWPEAERPAGFCPARAEQRTGSPLQLDPEIQRRMEALAAADR